MGLDEGEELDLRADYPSDRTLGLTRRVIRYWSFRIQKKLEDGTSIKGIPNGLKAYVEKMDGFNGWESFAKGAPRGWDFSVKEPLTIVYRNHSIHDEWDAELSRMVQSSLTRIDPPAEDEETSSGSEGNI